MRAARVLVVLASIAASRAATAQDATTPAPQQPAPDATAEPAARASPSPDAVEKHDRRAALARLAGKDAAVLVLAADDSPGFTGGTQNLDYAYLSPFDARGAAVLVALQPGAAATEAPTLDDRVYLRPKSPASELWTGKVAGPGDNSRTAGLFAAAPPIDRLAADVAEILKSRKTLWVSAGGPADGSKLIAPLLTSVRAKLAGTWVRLVNGPGAGAEDAAESVRHALPERFPRDKGPVELLAAVPSIDVRSAWRLTSELREAKSASEIARIRAACSATAEGMIDALRAARPGDLEMTVAARVEVRCRLAGCARQAYPSIVGSGPNSCVLHYGANTRVMQDGELVVMDIGGEFEGYASDVTRTFPVSGRFTEEQARIYDAVLAAQEAGIAAVRPGATIKDVHAAASGVLKERGLIQWFPHGTSHSVGLDVHDPFRPDAPLRVGSVLTVEPGVYIAEKALGVRIEDTVLVTETGCEVLSAGVRKTRADIEALMAKEPRPTPR